MKILFVENRYKTGFWEIIARELVKEGHEICWIVQNHLFKPEVGESIVIPYFRNQAITNKDYTPDTKKVIQSNRGLNYFGIQSDDFIFYYQEQIRRAFDRLRPDMAFGESTLFHELLIINECRSRDILFLHPTTCRYPTGRFSFYLYDTLEPFGGSGETMEDGEALTVINQIVNRSVVPDYMKVIKPRLSLRDAISDKLKLSFGYFMGERFNTPSPFAKKSIERKKDLLIAEWDAIAMSQVKADERFKILYPMQMQPEANIDVWGHPYNNQLDVIKSIVVLMRADDVLYIKPNPKSKYELTEELIQYVKENPGKVIPLTHSTPMQEVFPYIDFVITVTGTIAFECIWGDKPFISLRGGLQKRFSLFENVEERIFTSFEYSPYINKEKVNLINDLVSTSYKGTIGDMLTGKNVVDDRDNLTNVIRGFFDVIKLHKQ
jgi:hypothetical protein